LPYSPLQNVTIIGGGPAGLAAARELQRYSAEHIPVVYEAGELVGGIARTESHRGFRFDIGGHRFFTKVREVEQFWRETLGEDLIVVPRMSRIFYRGKFYSYPLKLYNALSNIGLYETFRIGMSYLKWKVWPSREEDTFDTWVMNRFGGRLYMHFFRSYTEKVWGVPASTIRADWAAQRIQNLSLTKAVLNAITGSNNTSSLIERFLYPRLGPGMMWEKARDLVLADGGEVHMRSKVVRLRHDGERVTAVEIEQAAEDGAVRRFTVEPDHVINSMALRDLIEAMDPPPPAAVLRAARRLKYRDFLIVTLILNHPDPFPDNWIYVHSPSVKVGRIQNFRAWSPDMTPNDHQASIGMEYFCNEGDELWSMSNEALIDLAGAELEKIGLADRASVVDGAIIRQRKAYPVYDAEYRDALEEVQAWLSGLRNFQTVGRNGLHRYNNQDHSMLTGMLAARNIVGERHDVWSVNLERSYHEEFQVPRRAAAADAV
jgi:protoporphyrinogen oxidase